jgi:hypothetical protein
MKLQIQKTHVSVVENNPEISQRLRVRVTSPRGETGNVYGGGIKLPSTPFLRLESDRADTVSWQSSDS